LNNFLYNPDTQPACLCYGLWRNKKMTSNHRKVGQAISSEKQISKKLTLSTTPSGKEGLFLISLETGDFLFVWHILFVDFPVVAFLVASLFWLEVDGISLKQICSLEDTVVIC
jgi:hypothetical protein